LNTFTSNNDVNALILAGRADSINLSKLLWRPWILTTAGKNPLPYS